MATKKKVLVSTEIRSVLSLFDGLGCGQLALERAGVSYNKYYTSELDDTEGKYGAAVSRYHYPNNIRLGDVTKWRDWDIDWSSVDLLMGGSPCQGFSFAGKQLNFEDPRSKLFFEFVHILEKCKPKYFLLENVVMKKEYQDLISDILGIEPVMINSALVSAQNRKRLYWTNIPNVAHPKDKGIMLKDIVHENIDISSSACMTNGKSYALTASYNGAVWWNSIERKQKTMLFEELQWYIVPFDKTLQILDKEVERGKVGYFRKDSQANRVYYIHGKGITLCGESGGAAAKMGQYLFGHTKKNSQGDGVYCEDEKSATLNASSGGTAGKGNILFGCITPDRIEKRQNGQRFSEGKKFYTLTAQDKHGILVEGYIRKLTPIECERLQTVPDNYTSKGDMHPSKKYVLECAKAGNVSPEYVEAQISDSQRYKMLGNGWTVDVIAHILKGILSDAAPITTNKNVKERKRDAYKKEGFGFNRD